jgi:predicted phosphodiesterase
VKAKRKIKVFVISDTHFPFHNKRAYEEMLRLLKQERPTHVVQIGDLLDQYVYSRYNRQPEVGDDTVRGLVAADKMWRDIKKLAPTSKCFQVLGNHDVRLRKRIEDAGIATARLSQDAVKDYQFKGVTTLKSDRDFLEIDGVVYTHGWKSKSIDHAKHFNKPTVHGHRHRPCIEVDRPGLWSMDVGFLADERSVPLSYTLSTLTKWTLACGIVEDGHPKLIFLGGK